MSRDDDVQELIDRARISDAVQAYCDHCDSGDVEAALSLFADDGVIDLGGGATVPADQVPWLCNVVIFLAGYLGPSLFGLFGVWLLVHGWTCDGHDWAPVLDALQARHRVLVPDLRAHGRSPVPPGGGLAPRQHAADLAALLQRLGTGPVVVVGHSLGGMVAAAMAVEHPRHVLATVVVEPAYGQPAPALEWLQGVAAQFGTEEGNELAADLQASTEPDAPAWLRTWHRRRTLGTPPELLAAGFRGMYCDDAQFGGQPRTDDYLAGRSCPTLALHRLPAMAAWERTVLTHPASRVETWEGLGHWLHQERPAEFADLVLGWVAGLPADRALQGAG